MKKPRQVIDLPEMRRRAVSYSRGDEDFAQFAVLYCLERKVKNPADMDLRIVMAEYMRKLLGRTGKRTAVFVPEIPVEASPSRSASPYTIAHLASLLDGITDKIDRAYLLLYFRWGLAMHEVAEVFGVTEAGVSLRMKGIMERIKDGRPKKTMVTREI